MTRLFDFLAYVVFMHAPRSICHSRLGFWLLQYAGRYANEGEE
jgi:hypothetical protein